METRMIVQIVKVTSGLPDAEVRATIAERAPQFRALSGLLQKYYTRERETGEYVGIYVWDGEESLHEFRESDLARTIPAAYRVEGAPQIAILDVISLLRAEEGESPRL